MKMDREIIKNNLSEASALLLECTEKATVLIACHEYGALNDGEFPGVGDQDVGNLHYGMSRTAKEIIERISAVQNIIWDAELFVKGVHEATKEVTE